MPDITQRMEQEAIDTLLHLEDSFYKKVSHSMLKIQRNPDYSHQSEKCDDASPCLVCGRPCPDPRYMIHIDIYINAYLPGKPIDGGADYDLCFYPIGTNCLKKHPELAPYAVKQETAKQHAPKASDWKALYFDLYRQTCGDELASDEECMKDAGKRLDILKTYREKVGQDG